MLTGERAVRRLLVSLLAVFAGCRTCTTDAPCDVEARVAAVVSVRATPDVLPCAGSAAALAGPMDLPALWNLALANNPSLREAAPGA